MQNFPDFPDGKDWKKSPNVRTSLKLGQFVSVEPCYIGDRHF
jgi:hypothetical protein